MLCGHGKTLSDLFLLISEKSPGQPVAEIKIGGSTEYHLVLQHKPIFSQATDKLRSDSTPVSMMESFFKNLSRMPQGPPSDDGSATGWDDEIPQPDSSNTAAPTSDKAESTRSSITCAAQGEENSRLVNEQKSPEQETLPRDDCDSSKRADSILSGDTPVSTESQQT